MKSITEIKCVHSVHNDIDCKHDEEHECFGCPDFEENEDLTEFQESEIDRIMHETKRDDASDDRRDWDR